MSIAIQCPCGMRLAAKEESAGKMLACPNCGAKLKIPKPGASSGPVRKGGVSPAMGFPTSKRGHENKGDVKFALSRNLIILIICALLVPTIVFAIKLGPLRAVHDWQAAEPVMEGDVEDIVRGTLEARMKKLGFDTDKPQDMPKIKATVIDGPIMPFRMPTSVDFQGTSSGGKFYGTYHPADRSAEARVDDLGKTINVRANMRDNKLTIESMSP